MSVTPPIPSLAPEQPLISRDERWAALERVAASMHLKRAARLREFLLYVGRRSLDEDASELHEQEIGSFVFGRPASYDTSQDNIVRVNASELRKRLESYFSSEGASDPLLITIPRGSYAPVFERRAAPQQIQIEVQPQPLPPPEPSALDPAPAPAAPRPSRAIPLLWAALAVLLAVSLTLAWQNRTLAGKLSSWKSQPTLQLFWSSFFGSGVPTDIVLADTTFALAEDIARRPLPLDDYLNRNYAGLEQAPNLSSAEREDLQLVLSRNNGSVGDFKVAERIRALDPASPDLHLAFSREYAPSSMKTDNVILIGSRKSNPWVDLFEAQLNFTIGYDPQTYRSFVTNKHPAPEEQPRYEGGTDLSVISGYSVVAFLPNLSHTRGVLIIEGTDSQATDAAGEFLTSEDSLARLKQRLAGNAFPYFEVLLKTSRLTGTPFRSEIVAVRTLPRS